MDIEQLKADEIAKLSIEESFSLESLINEGEDALLPVSIEFPKRDGTIVLASALIKPLTSVEYDNAVRLGMNKRTDNILAIEILKRGLFTTDGNNFPIELIEKIPAGVAMKLVEKIHAVSGISINEDENEKLMETLVGF